MIPSTHYQALPRHLAFRRPSRWITVVAAAGAAAIAISGCSKGATHTAASNPALHQIKLAADTSAKVNSLTASLSVHSVGSHAGGLTGTIQMQMKPATLIEATFNVAAANSPSIHLDEILTSQAIYFKDPAFAKSAGKPWVKVRISQLSSKSGISVGSLLQNLEGSNPLDQTRLFTASKDVRVVGAQTIDGVPTTEYAGTYAPQTAYAGLNSRLRKLLGPMLRSIGTHPVHFHVWIDAQHMIKKADDTESVRGQTVTTTFTVTSVNQPVRVTLPKTGETAPLPKL
jgi:hypothetical protein